MMSSVESAASTTHETGPTTPPRRWPATADGLVDEQRRLAAAAEAQVDGGWTVPAALLAAACFVAFEPGTSGPGAAGDRAWAAAAAWWVPPAGADDAAEGLAAGRSVDAQLRGRRHERGAPRKASDVVVQAVVSGEVPAPYATGLLALREGPILEAAVRALDAAPDVVLVDGTGLDHPRRAGLAVHLGAVLQVPTIGVTHRSLVASGDPPPAVRGETSPLVLDDQVVARWVCTRTGARPVVAHAGWRTSADTAADVVLATSTGAARTPVPLQEARRAAREARAIALGRWG